MQELRFTGKRWYQWDRQIVMKLPLIAVLALAASTLAAEGLPPVLGLPFSPGVATPSEVEQAMSLGFKVLKFFPAGDAGGPRMLRSLSGPYGHTGVQFIPTGGVTMDNLGDYLAVPTVMAVGGTWIASREAIKSGQWHTIRDNCRQVVDLLRGGH